MQLAAMTTLLAPIALLLLLLQPAAALRQLWRPLMLQLAAAHQRP